MSTHPPYDVDFPPLVDPRHCELFAAHQLAQTVGQVRQLLERCSLTSEQRALLAQLELSLLGRADRVLPGRGAS